MGILTLFIFIWGHPLKKALLHKIGRTRPKRAPGRRGTTSGDPVGPGEVPWAVRRLRLDHVALPEDLRVHRTGSDCPRSPLRSNPPGPPTTRSTRWVTSCTEQVRD